MYGLSAKKKKKKKNSRCGEVAVSGGSFTLAIICIKIYWFQSIVWITLQEKKPKFVDFSPLKRGFVKKQQIGDGLINHSVNH